MSYCTGADLGARNPSLAVTLEANEMDSMAEAGSMLVDGAYGQSTPYTGEALVLAREAAIMAALFLAAHSGIAAGTDKYKVGERYVELAPLESLRKRLKVILYPLHQWQYDTEY